MVFRLLYNYICMYIVQFIVHGMYIPISYMLSCFIDSTVCYLDNSSNQLIYVLNSKYTPASSAFLFLPVKVILVLVVMSKMYELQQGVYIYILKHPVYQIKLVEQIDMQFTNLLGWQKTRNSHELSANQYFPNNYEYYGQQFNPPNRMIFHEIMNRATIIIPMSLI